MNERPSRIVVVEDEQSDLTFLTKAFERGQKEHEITPCASADQFLEHLAVSHAADQLPDIALLDLSLPGLSGLDALRTIRGGDLCPELVVIVLTSSSYRREVAEAYAAGANAFVTKPVRLGELDRLVELIEGFWLDIAQLPYT